MDTRSDYIMDYLNMLQKSNNEKINIAIAL